MMDYGSFSCPISFTDEAGFLTFKIELDDLYVTLLCKFYSLYLLNLSENFVDVLKVFFVLALFKCILYLFFFA